MLLWKNRWAERTERAVEKTRNKLIQKRSKPAQLTSKMREIEQLQEEDANVSTVI